MSEKEVLLTKEGLEKLEAELDYLKNVKRIEVAQRIKVALGFGDLSENSEYEDAKNEQAMVEGQIVDLETKIRNARLFEATSNATTVDIGSTVRLLHVARNIEMEYTIVGSIESDPANRRISNESPLGGAIIGHKEGEVVQVPAPKGTLEYKILEIK